MKSLTRLLAAAAVAASAATPALAAEPAHAAESTAAAVTAPSLFQWKAMAAAEADVLAKQLGKDSGPWLVKAANAHDSRFARAFTKMLSSELSARGVHLTTRENSDAVIELQIERNYIHGVQKYQPGTLSAITAGLWLVKGLTEITTPAGVATALAVGTDVALSLSADKTDASGAELAVTVVATKSWDVAASNTSLYVLSGQGQGAYIDLPGKTLKFAK